MANATLVRSLYRNLLRSSSLLAEEVARRPEQLSLAHEVAKFLLPAPLAVDPKNDGLRPVIREQFDAHRNYQPGEDVDELVDLAFRAMRQADARINQLQSDWQPKDSGVQFSCGECIRHRKFGYRGVIIGWDSKCQASKQWIKLMGVENLQSGVDQPFFHVLVDVRDRTDGQTTYVAQENVELLEAPGEPIQHPEVETFLSSFRPDERKYVIGEDLRAEYPED